MEENVFHLTTPENPNEPLIQERLEQLVILEEAKKRYRELKYPSLPLPAIKNMLDTLTEPELPTEHRVDKLWPLGDKVLIAAEAKAGKTVLTHNLARSLLTGENLFGEFKVKPVIGSVVIIDSEMNQAMLTGWLKKQGEGWLRNYGARLYPIALRGNARSFNILDDHTRIEWSERLQELQAEVLIVDPMGPFLSAMGLNENTEAREFLYALDELMLRANISDYVVTHHMGHGDDRARGDSAILGWPAVTWNYKLGKIQEKNRRIRSDHKSVRSLNIVGRIEEIEDFQITFDKESNHLTYSDVLQAPMFKSESELTGKKKELVDYVRNMGEKEITKSALAVVISGNKQANIDLIDQLVDDGIFVIRKDGDHKTAPQYVSLSLRGSL